MSGVSAASEIPRPGRAKRQEFCTISEYTEVAPMLVLSRRESERIRLGDSIVVTVVRVAGDRVRLGIEAPSDILVLRDELDARPDAEPFPAVKQAG